MLYRIADLIAEIPITDGLAARCRNYLYDGNAPADITVYSDLYRPELYGPGIKTDTVAYMESAAQFYRQLLNFDGLYLHASTVVRDGKAYLFSGYSGTGKSTHTHLWIDTFGGDTRIINDDKPALRRIDGVWYAYGTPWCGKNGINLNEKVPVAGICFLKQAPHNRIRRISPAEAVQKMLGQTMHRFNELSYMDAMLRNLECLAKQIPIYEMENLPEPAAAQLSYETMLKGALEAKL